MNPMESSCVSDSVSVVRAANATSWCVACEAVRACRPPVRIALLLFVLLIGRSARGQPVSGEEVVLVRLKYTVDSEAAGAANDWNAKEFGKVLQNLSETLNGTTTVRTAREPVVLTLESPEIFLYPFLFMTGHHGCRLNEAEVANLREHLTKGGFLLATACCGNEPFAKCFEREMKKVFPDADLKVIPPDHPVYHSFYTIQEVKLFFGASQRAEGPSLKGIDIDGRTAVILSPYALTCGWTKQGTCGASCRRIAAVDAFKMGVNIVIYALTY